MAQEELAHRYSNSSGGDGGGSSSSRSSKKLKDKKVPQRGLGVAQLEKIRLDEQQKKDGSISSSISLVSSSNSSASFRHNPSSSLIPLPPHVPTNLSSQNSMFIQDSFMPSIDFLHPNYFALPNASDGDGGEMGWPAIPGLGQGYLPKFWNGDYNFEGQNNGLAVRSNVKLPFESNPISAPPIVIESEYQIQHQPPTSLSLVNASSGMSSSSLMNYPHMEPPSNQSFHINNMPMWSEDEKMVGRKRPYPFSLDNVPLFSFPCNVPPVFVPPTNKSNQPSCGKEGTVNFELSNPIFSTLFGEGPSSSGVLLPELNPMKAAKENEYLNGDFLTLAPPTTTVTRPSSKSKHPLVFLNSRSQKLPYFESIPLQGSDEDPIHPAGPSGSMHHQQPFYNFYPSAKARISQVTSTMSKSSRGVGENLDLNLKL